MYNSKCTSADKHKVQQLKLLPSRAFSGAMVCCQESQSIDNCLDRQLAVYEAPCLIRGNFKVTIFILTHHYLEFQKALPPSRRGQSPTLHKVSVKTFGSDQQGRKLSFISYRFFRMEQTISKKCRYAFLFLLQFRGGGREKHL